MLPRDIPINVTQNGNNQAPITDPTSEWATETHAKTHVHTRSRPQLTSRWHMRNVCYCASGTVNLLVGALLNDSRRLNPAAEQHERVIHALLQMPEGALTLPTRRYLQHKHSKRPFLRFQNPRRSVTKARLIFLPPLCKYSINRLFIAECCHGNGLWVLALCCSHF